MHAYIHKRVTYTCSFKWYMFGTTAGPI